MKLSSCDVKLVSHLIRSISFVFKLFFVLVSNVKLLHITSMTPSHRHRSPNYVFEGENKIFNFRS